MVTEDRVGTEMTNFEFKGKFYDAETPDGVSDWKELPWMQSFYKAKKQYPSDIKKL